MEWLKNYIFEKIQVNINPLMLNVLCCQVSNPENAQYIRSCRFKKDILFVRRASCRGKANIFRQFYNSKVPFNCVSD